MEAFLALAHELDGLHLGDLVVAGHILHITQRVVMVKVDFAVQESVESRSASGCC